MSDPRFRAYLVPGPWMRELFAAAYGDACVVWSAGIDTDAWSDARAEPKDIDVLIYDKVTFKDAAYEDSLVAPLVAALDARGLTHHRIRYRRYVHTDFRALLGRSRCMAFLSETETQGIAYQEAMACNVPILAWDNGWWLDRQRTHGADELVAASSVPYFDDRCGVKFRDAAGIPEAVDVLLARRDSFQPRQFVIDHLSMEASATRYVALYAASAGAAARA